MVLKLAWGIWWTLIKALKNLKICNLMGSFCSKCNASARKFQRNCVMTLKADGKLKWKLTRGLKNDKVFSCEQLKVWRFPLNGFLLSKAYKVLFEKVQKSYLSWHWRVIQTLNKNSFFVWKKIREIWWILTQVVGNLKICTLMGYFCQKYVMLELK